jgi:hypothetical protein
MRSTLLLTISLAVLSDAFPQTPPKEPSQGKAGASFLSGLSSLLPTTPPGADGPDLRGLVDFLRSASVPKLLGSFGITALDPLFKVPDIQTYGKEYLDFRNISNFPFIVKWQNPKPPTGCSPYEVLIGRFLIMVTPIIISTPDTANQLFSNFSSWNWRGWRIWIHCWRSPYKKGQRKPSRCKAVRSSGITYAVCT